MTISSPDAMILRVVGHILFLPVEEQLTEIARIKRYARLYGEQISDDVRSYIERSEFSALYQHLFPIVHPQLVQQNAKRHLGTSEFQPSIVSVTEEGRALVENVEVSETEAVQSTPKLDTATGMDSVESMPLSKGSVNDMVSETTERDTSDSISHDRIGEEENTAEGSVEAPKDTESTDDSTVVTEPAEESVGEASKVEPTEVEEPPTDGSQTKSSTELSWSNAFYNKLLRRYRAPRRAKKETKNHSLSRWDFWHRNAGLMSLSEWLESSEFTGLWKNMFAHTIEGLERHGLQSVADLILQAPVEYEKFPFSTIDRSIVEGEVHPSLFML